MSKQQHQATEAKRGWQQLGGNLVGAVSCFLGTVPELREMALTCRSWHAGQHPEALAAACALTSRKWPRSFADTRVRSEKQQAWSAFVEQRRRVDGNHKSARAAYAAFDVGDCQLVAAAPRFLWLADADQDKLIAMTGDGISRVRLRSLELKTKAGEALDIVYDAQTASAVARPLPTTWPRQLGEAPAPVRIFSASTGRCVARAELGLAACTQLLAQYVDARSKTAAFLTYANGADACYQLHLLSFAGVGEDDEGEKQLHDADWQIIDLALRSSAPAPAKIVGLALDMRRRSLILLATSSAGNALVTPNAEVFGEQSSVGQVIRLELPTMPETARRVRDEVHVASDTATPVVWATSERLSDATNFQVDWADSCVAVGNHCMLFSLDLDTLGIRAASWPHEELASECDDVVASSPASVLRLHKCRSTLCSVPWGNWLRWPDNEEYEPQEWFVEARDPTFVQWYFPICDDALFEAAADESAESAESAEPAEPAEPQGAALVEADDGDGEAKIEDESKQPKRWGRFCTLDFRFDRHDRWELRLPDCYRSHVAPRIWAQADWLAFLWPGGLLHVANFGARQSACVDLAPRLLQMDKQLRQLSPTVVAASAAGWTAPSKVEVKAEFKVESKEAASTALPLTCAQEQQAAAAVVDTVSRVCVCGPPSDGPGVHQLRLQAAASTAAAAAVSKSAEAEAEDASLVAPWGARALPFDAKDASAADGSGLSALAAFSHVVRGPRNRDSSCWMDSIVTLLLALPRVRAALLAAPADAAGRDANSEFGAAMAALARVTCNSDPARRSSLRKKLTRATERVRAAFEALGFARGRGHDVSEALETALRLLPAAGAGLRVVRQPATASLLSATLDNRERGDGKEEELGLSERLLGFIAVEVVGADDAGAPVLHAAVVAPDARRRGSGIWLFDDTLGSRASNFQGGLLRRAAADVVTQHYAKNACVAVFADS